MNVDRLNKLGDLMYVFLTVGVGLIVTMVIGGLLGAGASESPMFLLFGVMCVMVGVVVYHVYTILRDIVETLEAQQ